jgi:2-methylcitrate dehydratase PrpD
MAIDHETGVAHYLAQLIHRIGSTPFSEEDRSLVRQHMLDAVGAAFIGCRSEVFDDLTKLCPKVENGCAWPGSGTERTSPLDAGMVWAFAINASVFEDGSREGACHPAGVVMPTIIALSKGKSWDLIDTSAIAGYDVMVRLARSGNPEFTRKGFHPTSITAPFGAAAAASVLLGHDLSRTQNALCLAALGSAGLISAFKKGHTQPLQVAWGVRSGMVAAMIAGAGHSGYSRIIEEDFYPAYLSRDPDPPVDHPLEYEYAIKGSYLKPYPGCRHLHPSLDAFGKVLTENKINPGQIKNIHVRTYKIAVETEIDDLRNRGDAYFNIPYALAARAVLGKNDWEAFDEKHFTNEGLIELMKKIKVSIDPEVDSLYPSQRGSIVEVHTVDGDTLYGTVSHSLGEPENPLPVLSTREKFRDAARSFLSRKSMDRLERLLDVSSLSEPAKSFFETASENTHALGGEMR